MATMKEWTQYGAKHKMWSGLGLVIFGAVLWWSYQSAGTFRWDLAFIIIGILMFLKGWWMKSGKR